MYDKDVEIKILSIRLIELFDSRVGWVIVFISPNDNIVSKKDEASLSWSILNKLKLKSPASKIGVEGESCEILFAKSSIKLDALEGKGCL